MEDKTTIELFTRPKEYAQQLYGEVEIVSGLHGIDNIDLVKRVMELTHSLTKHGCSLEYIQSVVQELIDLDQFGD